MKKNYFLLLTAFYFFSISAALAWGLDVAVNATNPRGQTSVVATSDGTLYASVPEISLNPTYAMSIYQSNDNGATWQQLNMGGGSPGQIVLKSKMLVTGNDTVVCVFQISTDIYTLNIMTGVLSSFTTLSAHDFDAVASPNNNSIYLFVDASANSNLNRYSSTDAGLTWTGSTALVSGDAARPRVYMSGTRLFLAYFGSLQSDVALSKIVTAYYNETGVGTLVSVGGSFQDIVTSTTIRKHQFQPVDVGGNAWFFWTEGTSPSVLKCRISLDGGLNYGAEFVISGSPTMEVEVFDAKHFTNPVTSGVQLAYYADSVQSGTADPFTESIQFSSADILSPQTFSSPQQISDLTVDASSANYNVTLVTYVFSFSEASGILWVEDDGNISSLYYDASSSIVNGVGSLNAAEFSCRIFPNPFKSELNISWESNQTIDCCIRLMDVNGRILFRRDGGFPVNGKQELKLDFPELAAGVYYLGVGDARQVHYKKIVKM